MTLSIQNQKMINEKTLIKYATEIDISYSIKSEGGIGWNEESQCLLVLQETAHRYTIYAPFIYKGIPVLFRLRPIL